MPTKRHQKLARTMLKVSNLINIFPNCYNFYICFSEMIDKRRQEIFDELQHIEDRMKKNFERKPKQEDGADDNDDSKQQDHDEYDDDLPHEDDQQQLQQPIENEQIEKQQEISNNDNIQEQKQEYEGTKIDQEDNSTNGTKEKNNDDSSRQQEMEQGIIESDSNYDKVVENDGGSAVINTVADNNNENKDFV